MIRIFGPGIYLTIVNTDFSLFFLLSFSAHCFPPPSGIPRKQMYPKKNTEASFWVFFLLFTASVWSRKPGPTLVPGVLHIVLRVYHQKFQNTCFQRKVGGTKSALLQGIAGIQTPGQIGLYKHKCKCINVKQNIKTVK